jgi:hypothetical protein
MKPPQTTDELVKLIQEGNDELYCIIDTLDESQIEAARVQGFRSIKDILAHITHWNKQGIKWIDSVYQGEPPEMPVNGETQEAMRDEMALINEAVHRINQDRPLRKVLDEYRETIEIVLDQVRKLEMDHLESVFDFPWASETVTGRTIVMWRHWHLKNHMKHIKTWLDANR